MYIPLKPLFSRHNGIGVQFTDEPTGSLDSKTSDEIIKMLFELNSNGITIVIVTHNLEIANQCHHIIEIKDGNIIKDICS